MLQNYTATRWQCNPAGVWVGQQKSVSQVEFVKRNIAISTLVTLNEKILGLTLIRCYLLSILHYNNKFIWEWLLHLLWSASIVSMAPTCSQIQNISVPRAIWSTLSSSWRSREKMQRQKLLKRRRSEWKETRLRRRQRSPKPRPPFSWSQRERSMRCCVVRKASKWWGGRRRKKLIWISQNGSENGSSELSVPCFISFPNQTPRRQSRLFCRYYDNNHNPKYVLSPVKQQDEWDRPYIVRYLDIISDKEIELVKQLAKPRVSNLWILFLACWRRTGIDQCV